MITNEGEEFLNKLEALCEEVLGETHLFVFTSVPLAAVEAAKETGHLKCESVVAGNCGNNELNDMMLSAARDKLRNVQ